MIKRLIAITQVMVFGFAILGLGLAEPAEAACTSPSVTVSPRQGPPGSGITVSGKHFRDGCHDVITCGAGLPCTEPPPEPPTRGIEIVFEQRGRSWPLATVDAHSDYTFSVSTSVPSEAHPGTAMIKVIKAEQSLPVSFIVGDPSGVKIDKERLNNRNRIPPGQLRKIRERLKDRPDPDDEDIWVGYVAAAGAIALVGLGAWMLRRRGNAG